MGQSSEVIETREEESQNKTRKYKKKYKEKILLNKLTSCLPLGSEHFQLSGVR